MWGLLSIVTLAVAWILYSQNRLWRQIRDIWKFLRESEEQRVRALQEENENLRRLLAAYKVS